MTLDRLVTRSARGVGRLVAADAAPIERSVASDPYVKNGLVTRHRIRPWTVVIGGATP